MRTEQIRERWQQFKEKVLHLGHEERKGQEEETAQEKMSRHPEQKGDETSGSEFLDKH